MRILIIDDDELFRLWIAQIIMEFSIADIVLEAESLDAGRALIQAQHHCLDLVLLDYIFPEDNGLGLLKEMHMSYPALPVVLLSGNDNYACMRQSIDAGASGFIPKDTTQSVLISAIQLVLAGGVYIPPNLYAMSENEILGHQKYQLTLRQKEVLKLVRESLCNKKIATALNISEATVKAHLTVILKAHGASSRTQLLEYNS